jgi:hypothetical protein
VCSAAIEIASREAKQLVNPANSLAAYVRAIRVGECRVAGGPPVIHRLVATP